MTKTKSDKKDYSWLGPVISLLAVVACYGTLATVLLLSFIGISVEINEALMVKLISGLLVIALAGMVYSYRAHKHSAPLTLSIMASLLLLWVFFGSYSKPLELAGFALLFIASVWDFRARRRICKSACAENGKT